VKGYLEPFILQDSFYGRVSSSVDELDLEDDAKGAITDDLDALVVDVFFYFRLAVDNMFRDDSLRIQIGYTHS
jgi:hypothetical protein